MPEWNMEILLVCIFYAWVISLFIFFIVSILLYNTIIFIAFIVDLVGGIVCGMVYFLIDTIAG